MNKTLAGGAVVGSGAGFFGVLGHIGLAIAIGVITIVIAVWLLDRLYHGRGNRVGLKARAAVLAEGIKNRMPSRKGEGTSDEAAA